MTIAGDKLSLGDFKAFLQDTFLQYRKAMKKKASLYCCHPSSFQREFENALVRAGFEVRQQIIWAKNTFAWGHGRYKFQHEPIFYAHLADEQDRWYGDKTQSTLWQFPKPAANRLHPTAKPVEMVEHALANSSRPDDLVLDLFGGSGSTLIACERTHRVCRMAELDPKYADGIVQRWQDFTGREALLTATGETFETVSGARDQAAAAVA
jgi:DNA modification methylase